MLISSSPTTRHKLLSIYRPFEFTVRDKQLLKWKETLTEEERILLYKTIIFGHRFACLFTTDDEKYQENNYLPLFLALSTHSLYGLECDISKTKDDNLVIAHDARMFNVSNEKNVDDLTIEEIRNASQNKHFFKLETLLYEFRNYILRMIQHKKKTKILNLEIKGEGIANDVIRQLENFPDLSPYILLSSFNKNNILQSLPHTQYPVSILITQSADKKSYENTTLNFAIQIYEKHPKRIHSINIDSDIFDDPVSIDRINQCRITFIYAYSSSTTAREQTVHNPNNVAKWSKLLKNKTLGIFVDRPDWRDLLI